MKKTLTYIFVALLAGFFAVSCGSNNDDDDNNNNNNTDPTGNLHVYAKKDNTNGIAIGNCEVYIYKTEADRTAGNDFMYNLTGDDPVNEPAVFNDLKFNADEGGKYYIMAERQITGKMYKGLSEVLVPTGTTTSHHLAITEQ